MFVKCKYILKYLHLHKQIAFDHLIILSFKYNRFPDKSLPWQPQMHDMPLHDVQQFMLGLLGRKRPYD